MTSRTDRETARAATVIPLDPADKLLQGVIGRSIPSPSGPRTFYRADTRLASGATATTFFALRCAPDGETPVVLKLLNPSFVRAAGTQAILSAHKEAAALSRLNEQVPPTPFVVRLIDAGWVAAELSGTAVDLPWLAMEFVHGGPVGTTLTERVEHSIAEIGQAFDPWRAARVVDCLGRGTAAVHEVGVIHRDLKPDNVLCCGFAQDELFKVADFGVARAEGIVATFGGGIVGTMGYASPEQVMPDSQPIGPPTDVFALGSIVYFLLTGEEFFPARSLAEFLMFVQRPARRSVLQGRWLSQALRERELHCRAIDTVLTQATAVESKSRPQSAQAFAAALLPWLQLETWHRKTSFPIGSAGPPSRRWNWRFRLREHRDIVVRHVAWDGDGTCLFVTNQGLAFFDGTQARPAPVVGLPPLRELRFMRSHGPGRWLMAFDGSTFAIYTCDGVTDVTRFGDGSMQLDAFVGDLHDLAVAVGADDRGPALLTLSGGRWFKPVELPDVAMITSLARVGDAEWLVGGHRRSGSAYAARYQALDLHIEELATPPVRAIIAAAGDADLQRGLLGGADATVLWYERGSIALETLPSKFDISAVALDAAGGAWVAGAGRIAYRSQQSSPPEWRLVWEDDTGCAPIVSLFAQVGRVVAMTADGHVLEGVASNPD